MESTKYMVKFESSDLAEANKYADELREFILEQAANQNVNVEVNFARDDPETMDFGGTLILLLGTPALIAVAKGIGDWLRKRNTASITIETSDGRLVAKNISAKDAAALATKFKMSGA